MMKFEKNIHYAYISTPVTSRPEGTDYARRLAAGRRVDELENLWIGAVEQIPWTKFRSFDTETKPGMTDAEAMGACVKALMECEAMILDDTGGWLNSKGVAAELAVARIYGIEVVKVSELQKEKPKEDEK